MNVGLCCCYDNHNYGSMLQCLANYVAITDLGCECEIIRYRKQYSLFQKVKQIPRLFNGGNIRKMKRQFRAAQMARRYPAIAESRKLRDACFDGLFVVVAGIAQFVGPFWVAFLGTAIFRQPETNPFYQYYPSVVILAVGAIFLFIMAAKAHGVPDYEREDVAAAAVE